MRTYQRHRRSLTWIASLASALAIATAGATAVLAEDPACVVDGTPVTTQQLAADPTLQREIFEILDRKQSAGLVISIGETFRKSLRRCANWRTFSRFR